MSMLKRKKFVAIFLVIMMSFSINGAVFANPSNDDNQSSSHHVCLFEGNNDKCSYCDKSKQEAVEYVDHICVTVDGNPNCVVCNKNMYTRGNHYYWVEFTGVGTDTDRIFVSGIYVVAELTAQNKGIESIPWFHVIFSGYAYNDHRFTNQEVVITNLLGITGGDMRFHTFKVRRDGRDVQNPLAIDGFNKVECEYWGSDMSSLPESELHAKVMIGL